MKKINISVVIPAYNEEKRISHTLYRIDKFLFEKGYSYEIIVVNDGSTDGTAKVVNSLKPYINNLKLINLPENKGKGFAIKKGVLKANGEVILFTDADNSTDISHLNTFLQYLQESYDIVIASRALPLSKIPKKQPIYRRVLSKLGNKIINLLFSLNIKDTQCGFKLFKKDVAKNIFKKLTIDRWGFDIEILVIAKCLNYKVKEKEVEWINDPNSKVKLIDFFKTFKELINIKYNLITNKYQ